MCVSCLCWPPLTLSLVLCFVAGGRGSFSKVAMFYSMRPDGQFDDFSLHGACPVITGEDPRGFWLCPYCSVAFFVWVSLCYVAVLMFLLVFVGFVVS